MSSDFRDMENKTAGKYDDIINLPHHVSACRFPMSMHDRAAQFSSFKALTGLEAAKEGGRYVTFTGTVKKYDDAARQLVFSDGKRIPAEDISKVEPKSS